MITVLVSEKKKKKLVQSGYGETGAKVWRKVHIQLKLGTEHYEQMSKTRVNVLTLLLLFQILFNFRFQIQILTSYILIRQKYTDKKRVKHCLC